jgi:hypothetical protein
MAAVSLFVELRYWNFEWSLVFWICYHLEKQVFSIKSIISMCLNVLTIANKIHACVKKGAKVCIHIYRTHTAEIHTLHFKYWFFVDSFQYTYWFFVDPFSTCIGFLLTPSVLKSTLVLKGSRKKPIRYWFFVDPFSTKIAFVNQKVRGFHLTTMWLR